MARRKQNRPNKAGKFQGQDDPPHNLKDSEGTREGSSSSAELKNTDGTQEVGNSPGSDSTKTIYVNINSEHGPGDGHFDLAEVILCDVEFGEDFSSKKRILEQENEVEFALRLRLCMREPDKVRVGCWPSYSAKDVSVEFLLPATFTDCCENSEQEAIKLQTSVVFSGHFDGPDEGVSGLSHLISQGFVTLRVAADQNIVNLIPSCRMQIAITKKAFDASNGLSGNLRQPWKKGMMNAMSWLRPEVLTEEVIYGSFASPKREIDLDMFTESVVNDKLQNHFDTAGFYEAIKPSREEPMLEVDFPELLPQLRPYQRRASYWMVQREKGRTQGAAAEIKGRKICNPICVVVDSTDMHSQMYYNPFSGSISMQPECSLAYVDGGILADEMGLGKTVELLACILAHPQKSSQSGFISSKANSGEKGSHAFLNRPKRERVECVCGAVTESYKYTGLWVQCDVCDAWQHAECVGFDENMDESGSHFAVEIANQDKGIRKINSKRRRKVSAIKGDADVTETRGKFVCETCSELIQIAGYKTVSGATLIVCPAPILQQWHTEIDRHTKRGSLKVQVYGGVKNVPGHSTLESMGISVNKLADADVVLTTYDVLKSDLSHDSDRHYGDRRSMRFRKRYPVVPTPLTKIHWWRLCLDEAQMVESNATAATEMAMRLSAQNLWCVTGTPIQQSLEDMYGLLRFLRAEPFDDHRWWSEVMKIPYERGEVGAMQFTHDFFQQLMWRSTKRQVSDELNLPPQEERLSWLMFSPIEAHFYRRQHESCEANAREFISKCKDDVCIEKRQSRNKSLITGSEASCDSRLSHGEAAKLLSSLLKLRQACCHPQVGSSGLRSLQQSPMTMEEILQVLVAKAKTEGEEALRKLVVALNGLAALAIIDKDLSRAVSIYREALALSEENLEDFRLDPLLNLHILHNLAEMTEIISSLNTKRKLEGEKTIMSPKKRDNKSFENPEIESPTKRQRIDESCGSSSTRSAEQSMPGLCSTSDPMIVDSFTKYDPQFQGVTRTLRDELLVKQCEGIKEKYLSQFIIKLAAAQQEFRSAHNQVFDAKNDCQHTKGTDWWLDALELVEQKKDLAKELMEKIRDCLPGNDSRLNSSRLALRFRDISGLKYIVQTGLDALENSRNALLDCLIEVDRTMENPRSADIERVRNCPNCYVDNIGPLCLHCEMDELFQVYENRLFLLRTGEDGSMIASAEEALNLQKQRSALNRFFGGLSREKDKKNDVVFGINSIDKYGRHRQCKGHIQVSRSPSELEVILNIIKSFVKTRLGKDRMPSAKKHLRIFEAMRKEFTQARSLSVAQAQVLRAHDELKMAISRLRLRLPGEEASAIGTLCSEELVPTSVQLTGEKFVALTELSRIKGQLRYLKGLSLAKLRHRDEDSTHSGEMEEKNHIRSREATNDRSEQVLGKNGDETCPVCHEKLETKLMVFPCGHLLCCKCMVAMVEMPSPLHAISQRRRIMCPTCRYCTDFGNIAYVDDACGENSYEGTLNNFQDGERTEISLIVQGSFGTKMEAVTRRILWIKSIDPEAKILVFSCWKDVLDVLEHALRANDINFVRMKGGSNSDVAIRQFKGTLQQGEQYARRKKEPCFQPTPIQVLLLLFRHGANGLNLLEARHVILIEPLLNPAAESQAINRVHRIGQQETTFVHRFIVRETVEESIYKLNRSKPLDPSGTSGNIRKKDHFSLTLNDIDSLFSAREQGMSHDESREKFRAAQTTGDLRNLPPTVAAAMAAENRHKQALKSGTGTCLEVNGKRDTI